jgi:hypothetical protein
MRGAGQSSCIALDTPENPGYTPIAQWRTYRIGNFRRIGILPAAPKRNEGGPVSIFFQETRRVNSKYLKAINSETAMNGTEIRSLPK